MVAWAASSAWEAGWETLVAIGTLGLALCTGALAWSTRALAAASTDEQRAQWRPVVIVAEDNRIDVVTDSEDRDLMIVSVRNVGRGPAFAVQAQLRFGTQPAGASRPRNMSVLVPGEGMDLDIRVSENARRDLVDRKRAFPPSIVEIELSYYDVGERWHHTYLTATRSHHEDDGIRVSRVLVNETDRMLLPVHGSRRAKAEETRRQSRLWRRVGRAVRARLTSLRPK